MNVVRTFVAFTTAAEFFFRSTIFGARACVCKCVYHYHKNKHKNEIVFVHVRFFRCAAADFPTLESFRLSTSAKK